MATEIDIKEILPLDTLADSNHMSTQCLSDAEILIFESDSTIIDLRQHIARSVLKLPQELGVGAWTSLIPIHGNQII
ncbi:hypothetical protein IV02_00005 [Pseudomonas syringae]|uniref:Uncharacterized protein n=1 Tax=Pseudomonas syringae TaxID=317 RepID=A0A085VM44_PSESX|nr:hypothetical protein IV02_00005 [Pseudomonas syringae]